MVLWTAVPRVTAVFICFTSRTTTNTDTIRIFIRMTWWYDTMQYQCQNSDESFDSPTRNNLTRETWWKRTRLAVTHVHPRGRWYSPIPTVCHSNGFASASFKHSSIIKCEYLVTMVATIVTRFGALRRVRGCCFAHTCALVVTLKLPLLAWFKT